MGLVWTIINLIVLFLLLRHFLINPVSNIMEQRRKLIADGLQNAQDTQDAANRLKAEYEEALSGAKKESAEMLTKHGSMPGQSMTALLVKPERRRAISLRMQKKMCVSSVNRQ